MSTTVIYTPPVTQYTYAWPRFEHLNVEVSRVGAFVLGTFDLSADVWAVRWLGRCINERGEWEFEPSPSNRDDDFKERTRFPVEKAKDLALRAWCRLLVEHPQGPVQYGENLPPEFFAYARRT